MKKSAKSKEVKRVKEDAKKAIEIVKEVRDENESIEIAVLEEDEKQFKEMLLSNINKSEFVCPFFSDLMFATLITEGKVVNFPSLSRQSNYNSLPSLMPYNPEYDKKGFAGSRGRIMLSLCLNKSALDIIAFDVFNRKLENSQVKHSNIHRKLLAVSKAYFPEIHKQVKTLYPKASFKGQG